MAKPPQPVLRSARGGGRHWSGARPLDLNRHNEDLFELTSSVRTKLTRAARMGVKGAHRLRVELVVTDVDGVRNATKAPRTATV